MSNVAAQTMAWQRRMHNRPGPLGTLVGPTGGSGEQPSGLPQVELYIGGWVDVTALGLVRYTQGIKTTRGQSDETQLTSPGTAAFRLNNRDGRFSPRNPLGPYYGQIDKNTPVRISVQSGNTKSYRFAGEIAAWPANWDGTGNDSWIDIQASGILRRLSAGNPSTYSAMYLYWAYAASTNFFNSPSVPVIAYWPMEDLVNSTSMASGIGGAPMTISGTPTLASNSSFTISQSLPVLNGGSFRGTIPTYTPVVPTVEVGISSNELCIELLVEVPSSGDTSGAVLATLSVNGSIPTWEVVYTNTSNGILQIRAKDVNGNVLATSPATSSTPINGTLLCVGITLDQFGSNADGSCQISVVNNPSLGVQGVSTGLLAGTFGLGKAITLNPGGSAGLTQTAVGHVSVTTFNDEGNAAEAGAAGETAAARIQRLCGYANIPFELTGNASDTVVMGQQDVGTWLNLIEECVAADGGLLYELTDQVGLGYRTRISMCNQSPGLSLDYSQAQLADVPAPLDDDQFTRNDIIVTRTNGSSSRAQQETGALNVQDPPAGVGRVQTSITINCETDAQTTDLAGWRLHLGTVPEPRYPTIGLQLSREEITSSSVLRPEALGLMPGDRISIANPPSGWLAPDAISALVLGYTETFDQFLHHIVWNTMPESPWRIAISDDPVFGRADTDGSTLAAPALATDATLQVATTNPVSPLWTTSAGDFPFDIWVGGEQMTVTNITGASSPQTFTVTRSVNGVVKPQAQTTNVQLYQPATLTM